LSIDNYFQVRERERDRDRMVIVNWSVTIGPYPSFIYKRNGSSIDLYLCQIICTFNNEHFIVVKIGTTASCFNFDNWWLYSTKNILNFCDYCLWSLLLGYITQTLTLLSDKMIVKNCYLYSNSIRVHLEFKYIGIRLIQSNFAAINSTLSPQFVSMSKIETSSSLVLLFH
jgi:hypothetical protein